TTGRSPFTGAPEHGCAARRSSPAVPRGGPARPARTRDGATAIAFHLVGRVQHGLPFGSEARPSVRGAQVPWESSSLTGDLVVNAARSASPPAGAPTPTTDREALFWASIKDGSDPAAFEAYLRQYPGGTFAPLARQRLAGRTEKTAATTLAPFDGT